MSDSGPDWGPEPRRGCLAALFGAVALAVVSPMALLIQNWRSWRRGNDLRVAVDVNESKRPGHARIDVHIDAPKNAEPGLRRRLTDAVVRVAETLRAPDDVYHLVYRLRSETEPMTLPVGPQLQEFGERFSLVLSQGALSGRTVIWLTLRRGQALAEVADPLSYDPEAEGEPGGLLEDEATHWSMASEWAHVGPSLVIRLILIVPDERADRVRHLLAAVC